MDCIYVANQLLQPVLSFQFVDSLFWTPLNKQGEVTVTCRNITVFMSEEDVDLNPDSSAHYLTFWKSSKSLWAFISLKEGRYYLSNSFERIKWDNITEGSVQLSKHHSNLSGPLWLHSFQEGMVCFSAWNRHDHCLSCRPNVPCLKREWPQALNFRSLFSILSFPITDSTDADWVAWLAFFFFLWIVNKNCLLCELTHSFNEVCSSV